MESYKELSNLNKYGPGIWTTYHTTALLVAFSKTDEERKIHLTGFKYLTSNMISYVRCKNCKEHFIKNIEKYNIDSFIYNKKYVENGLQLGALFYSNLLHNLSNPDKKMSWKKCKKFWLSSLIECNSCGKKNDKDKVEDSDEEETFLYDDLISNAITENIILDNDSSNSNVGKNNKFESRNVTPNRMKSIYLFEEDSNYYDSFNSIYDEKNDEDNSLSENSDKEEHEKDISEDNSYDSGNENEESSISNENSDDENDKSDTSLELSLDPKTNVDEESSEDISDNDHNLENKNEYKNTKRSNDSKMKEKDINDGNNESIKAEIFELQKMVKSMNLNEVINYYMNKILSIKNKKIFIDEFKLFLETKLNFKEGINYDEEYFSNISSRDFKRINHKLNNIQTNFNFIKIYKSEKIKDTIYFTIGFDLHDDNLPLNKFGIYRLKTEDYIFNKLFVIHRMATLLKNDIVQNK